MAGKIGGCFIAGFFIGLLSIYSGAKGYLLLQKITNTPTSKVRSVAIGLTEVFGKVRNKDTPPSPISGIACVYWKIVAEYYKSGKGGGWKDLHTLDSKNLFYLEDETGKILIDPKDAEMDIPMIKYIKVL